MNHGIYKITCLPSQFIYVGQSINIENRWKQHLNELRNNKHNNEGLQEDFLKYGEVNFNFEVIAKCEPEALNMLESYYVKKYDNLNKSYNIMRGGGGRYKASVELTPDEYRIVQKFKENEKLDYIKINAYLNLVKVCIDNELVSGVYVQDLYDKSKGIDGVRIVKKEDTVESDIKELMSIVYIYIKRYIDTILDSTFKQVKGIIKFGPLYTKSDIDKKHLLLECLVIKTGEKFNKNIYF